MLDIQTEQAGPCTICRPVGELDAFNASQFRLALAAVTAAPQLVIDLAAVPFIDSAGLGALIGGIRRVRELGGEVVVACPRPSLARVLDSTGFAKVVAIASSVEEATVALGSPPDDGRPRNSTR